MKPQEHRDRARQMMALEIHGLEHRTQRAVEVLAHLAMADMEEQAAVSYPKDTTDGGAS